MEQLSDGVYRLGSRWVNFYLVTDGDAVTVVDTGIGGYFPQIGPALQQLGRQPSDVKAIVLTHTHTDHIGTADKLVEMTSAPVFVHRAEAGIATGAAKPVIPKGFIGNLWRPTMLSLARHFVSNKGLAQKTVDEVTPFEDGDVLDVPGTPRVVYAPGHSAGHSALVLEDRRVLFCGDALATLSVTTGATGPTLHPFNENRARAIAELDALEALPADLLLPGHGEPWRGPIADAVAAARSGA